MHIGQESRADMTSGDIRPFFKKQAILWKTGTKFTQQ